MGVRVPPTRPVGDYQRMLAGEPVPSGDWQQMVLANWIKGQGRQLVPYYRPVGHNGAVTLSAGNYYEYRFWDYPTYNNIDRRWGITMEGWDYQLTVPGGSAVDGWGNPAPNALYSVSNAMAPATFLQRRTSYSSTAAAIDLRIDVGGTDSKVHQLGMFELNRAELETAAANDGTNPAEFGVSQPIERQDMDNLFSSFGSDTSDGKRVLMNWAVPFQVNGSTSTAFARQFTSASYTSLFKAGIPVLGRGRYVGDTTKSIQMRLLAWVSGGGAATIRSNYNGSTGSAAAVSVTSPGWRTLGNIFIDSEDLDVTDGRRGSVWKTLNYEIAVSSGTCYVATAFAAENN
ncbi:MAG: hypothetical protein ACPGVG_14445 [Mycobacterium sp.]